MEEHKEAVKCYDRALELDPKNAHAWHHKGISLDKLGKDAEALRCYDRELEIDSETTVELDEGELKQSIRKE